MLGVGEAHSISNSSDYRKSNVTLFEHIQSHREVIVLSKLLNLGEPDIIAVHGSYLVRVQRVPQAAGSQLKALGLGMIWTALHLRRKLWGSSRTKGFWDFIWFWHGSCSYMKICTSVSPHLWVCLGKMSWQSMRLSRIKDSSRHIKVFFNPFDFWLLWISRMKLFQHLTPYLTQPQLDQSLAFLQTMVAASLSHGGPPQAESAVPARPLPDGHHLPDQVGAQPWEIRQLCGLCVTQMACIRWIVLDHVGTKDFEQFRNPTRKKTRSSFRGESRQTQ